MTSEITKLRSVEEISREAHVHWLQKSATAQLKGQGELTVLPYGYLGQAITETITHDRQQLLDAVVSVLEGLEIVSKPELKMINPHIQTWEDGYRFALDDAKTAIKNLLDVNK